MKRLITFFIFSIFTLVIATEIIAQDFLDKRFYIADDVMFRSELMKNKITPEQWISNLNKKSIELIFFGETHYDAYRYFLSKKIFSHLVVDILFLECDPEELSEILLKMDRGEKVDLLGANISAIIYAAKKVNPNIKIFGIAPTKHQKRWINLSQMQSKRRLFSWDGFTAQNLMKHYEKGKKHIILYGAYHCSYNSLSSGGINFFRLLKNNFNKSISMTNVLLIKSKSGGKLESYLELLEMADETFVLHDTTRIPEFSYNYDWDIKKYFDNYSTIIHFSN